MTVIDISGELLSAEVFPGDPAPVLTRLQSIAEGGACNLSALHACLHAGTHIDAPLHFVEGGTDIAGLDLDIFMGDCSVVAVFEPLLTGADIDALLPPGAKRLILKGFGKTRLSLSAAYALAAEELLLVGIDAPSIGAEGEEAAVHRALQMSGVAILEGLDLRGAQSGEYTLFAPPVKIAGADGAPCRAVLIK